MTTPTTCTTPPEGWACSRPAGHTGPCAATPLPGHVDRLRILAAAVTLTHEAQAAGMVLTIERRTDDPLTMCEYLMDLNVRSRRDSPQQVAAIGQEVHAGPFTLWRHPDGRERITRPGSIVDQDASWQEVGEMVLRHAAPPNARLYGAINNLMAHIGAHGVAYDYDLRVAEVMDALRAVDGGTFQPGLATEAAAMAATVPAGWVLVPEMPTKEMLAAAGTACEGRMYPASMTHGPRAQNTDRYIAMLAAATQAPVAGQPAEPSPDRSPGFESLRLWWIMLEAQWELCEERPADDKVVLQFMGSGASHMVTAGEIRQALDVTEPGPQGR